MMCGFASRFGLLAGSVLVLACLLAWPGQAGALTQTFYGQETFTVPEGVSGVSVVADGQGGLGLSHGLGAELSGELAVFPGEILYVHAAEVDGGKDGEYLGEQGGDSSSIATASILTPRDVLVMAGGGGGAGGSTTGPGRKGGNAGEAGEDGAEELSTGDFGEGGAAGELDEGGLGGLVCGSTTKRAGSGSFDGGGNGIGVREREEQANDFAIATSGGGGGGYYGGGGGGTGCMNDSTKKATEGAGGGGGSSFAPLGWTEALAPRGTAAQVKIEYGPVSAPTVTSVSPDEGKGDGETQVKITGTNLESVEAVDFGPYVTRRFTIESNTGIVALAPPGEGTVGVTVTGLEGSSTVEPGDEFTFEPVPVISGISPEEGNAAGGTPVTITGANFKEVKSIEFGDKPATDVTVESETQISAVTPEGNNEEKVTVHAGAGDSRPFTYTYGNPKINEISPEFGPSSGGTVVKITGERFREVESVQFGSTSASSFTVLSEHLIEAVAPPAGRGFEDFVEVANADGDGFSRNQFNYMAPPTIEKLKPKSGSTAGGTEVQITGQSLLDATEVHFGATAVTSFTVTEGKSSDVLTVISPPGTPGKAAITVTSPWGTSLASKKYEFTFKGTPTVTGLSPSSGPTAGGTSVQVSGTGFALGSATTFKFGSVEASSVDCTSNSSCTVRAPPAKSGKAGTVAVVATSGKKKSPASKADEFTYE